MGRKDERMNTLATNWQFCKENTRGGTEEGRDYMKIRESLGQQWEGRR